MKFPRHRSPGAVSFRIVSHLLMAVLIILLCLGVYTLIALYSAITGYDIIRNTIEAGRSQFQMAMAKHHLQRVLSLYPEEDYERSNCSGLTKIDIELLCGHLHGSSDTINTEQNISIVYEKIFGSNLILADRLLKTHRSPKTQRSLKIHRSLETKINDGSAFIVPGGSSGSRSVNLGDHVYMAGGQWIPTHCRDYHKVAVVISANDELQAEELYLSLLDDIISRLLSSRVQFGIFFLYLGKSAESTRDILTVSLCFHRWDFYLLVSSFDSAKDNSCFHDNAKSALPNMERKGSCNVMEFRKHLLYTAVYEPDNKP